MADETPVAITERDLRRIYAKINAHECVIRALVTVLADAADDKARAFEALRSDAMERADVLQRSSNSLNPDFVDEGRLETVAFVAETFERVKAA